MGVWCHAGMAPPCWPVSGLVDATFIAFPVLVQGTSGWVMKAEPKFVHLPLRGQRRLGRGDGPPASR